MHVDTTEFQALRGDLADVTRELGQLRGHVASIADVVDDVITHVSGQQPRIPGLDGGRHGPARHRRGHLRLL